MTAARIAFVTASATTSMARTYTTAYPNGKPLQPSIGSEPRSAMSKPPQSASAGPAEQALGKDVTRY